MFGSLGVLMAAAREIRDERMGRRLALIVKRIATAGLLRLRGCEAIFQLNSDC